MKSGCQVAAIGAAIIFGIIVGRKSSANVNIDVDAREIDHFPNNSHAQSRVDQSKPSPNSLSSPGEAGGGDTESFASGYQTLVAIIQGVAFAALIIPTQNGTFTNVSAVEKLTAITQLIVTLLTIIAVTEEYFQLVRAVRWIPTPTDTAVPYLLGVGEVAMAVSVGNNLHWWGSVSIMLIAGVVAFSYSFRRAHEDFFKSLLDYFHFKAVVQILAVACALAFVLAVVVLVFSVHGNHLGWLFAAAPICLPVLLVVFAAVGISRSKLA